MKRFIFLFVVMMTAINSHAEIVLNDNQFWWGYFLEKNASRLPYDGRLGDNQASTIDVAICIPANHPVAGSGTIKAIRFWLGNDISKMGDVTLWISEDLPYYDASTADYHQVVPKSSLSGQLNEIELTSPYSVDNEEVYVGFSFHISGKSYPIMCYGKDVDNAFFFRYSGEDWMDLYGYGYGRLAMQVLLDGVELNSYDATPKDFGVSYVEKGLTTDIPVEIINNGKEAISSISYTITTSGNVSEEIPVRISKIDVFDTGTAYISFLADADAKKHNKTLTITKVNGTTNEAKTKTAEGCLITILEKPDVLPVVEEFTGTWCGYCPYGIVGMEKAHEAFGDQVALIAVHKSDAMETNDYSAISTPSGYPGSRIDRVYEAYPDASGLKYYLNKILENRTTVASIKATASWTGIQKSAIKIDTKTKFVYSEDNGQYGIAYVLVEDGMTGTGSGWYQSNYLSGGSGSAEMEFWYNASSSVSGLEFNHVAVAAWGIVNGVDGSVKKSIVEGDVQNYSFTANIANNNLIQDKSKLKVIAMLIDRVAGIIVNASQVSINDYNPSAIDDIQITNNEILSRHGIDGRQVSAPRRGINIIRMNDGSVKKIIMK